MPAVKAAQNKEKIMSDQQNFMRDDFMEYTPTGLTLYQYLVQQAADFGDLPAISYYGIKTSYQTLFERIDEVERSLRAMGIGKGDVVAASLPGMPEGVALIYAINKIGAVYCAFDCRCKRAEVEDTLKVFKPKLVVVPDFQVKHLKGIRPRGSCYRCC